jgi:hypothetical protein
MAARGERFDLRPNQRLLLAGSERVGRRLICLLELVCGGLRWPRSRSAIR